MRLQTTRRFERDLKLAKKRGKNLEKLWQVVERLSAGEPLAPRNRMHRLSGDWFRAWECHIEPDWLLIWRIDDDSLVLIRTGTHADLFG
ncbi:MAG: type II toxin-antitoxin system YafQ family toxin [Rhodospirillaceae bacterium]|nr:type II toxin-antitoxin system YafQ family toxin [Rhodospirillaceae bacterium]MDE0616497.1 type II toxin-antitoxin system YafQ family toxin [Rhodospirillaceae bacterium]MXY41460.1 type II toxin-antitoxin system YafQ family toxin [Rhodospirillaceae bacterium]MYF08725.1 type II toxin-antitoxin system YafQ family toxin [Rhodospirillaceae bacterium]MYF87057.1 type II toxin-antitoxin system YafQ family toxin [Rhodospirillaceae bacterium]